MTVAGHPKALIPCDRVLGKPSPSKRLLMEELFFHTQVVEYSSKILCWCPFSGAAGDAVST
jgi:hypothetical protein